MRARFARPRRIVRGRLVAPVASAAAVALVAGVVVASPDTPTVRDDVQTVATTIPGFKAGADFSYDLGDIAWTGSLAGFEATGATNLPDGLTFEEGAITGTPTKSGVFNAIVSGTMNGQAVEIPVQLVVNNGDGSLPAEFDAGSSGAVQGSLGGEIEAGGQVEAGGQIATGSEGTDALLGAVSSIVVALGGDAGSVGELATGSTGGTEGTETPNGPLGSVSDSLLGTTPEGEETPQTSPLGSTATGEVETGGTGGLNTESLGPLGSLLDTGTDTDTDTGTDTGSTTGGQTTGGTDVTVQADLETPGSTVPGSSTPVDTGSLGNLAPGLALTGAALLGLAGLSIVLNGGSSAPGTSSSLLPILPGSSTTTGGGTTGSGPGSSTGTGPGSSTGTGPGGATGTRPSGSSGSVAPTVAAGTPNKVQAPGPTVANGRG